MPVLNCVSFSLTFQSSAARHSNEAVDYVSTSVKTIPFCSNLSFRDRCPMNARRFRFEMHACTSNLQCQGGRSKDSGSMNTRRFPIEDSGSRPLCPCGLNARDGQIGYGVSRCPRASRHVASYARFVVFMPQATCSHRLDLENCVAPFMSPMPRKVPPDGWVKCLSSSRIGGSGKKKGGGRGAIRSGFEGGARGFVFWGPETETRTSCTVLIAGVVSRKTET